MTTNFDNLSPEQFDEISEIVRTTATQLISEFGMAARIVTMGIITDCLRGQGEFAGMPEDKAKFMFIVYNGAFDEIQQYQLVSK